LSVGLAAATDSFLSNRLAARASAIGYSHEERLAGLSDHSPLILELAV
jgi:hypothetical protein